VVTAVALALATFAAAPQPTPTPIVYRVGGEVKPPVLVRKIDPQFKRSQGEHELGILILEGIIGRDGKIRDPKVLKGPKNSFTREALAAARQWEYKPAMRKGEAVDVYIVITFNHFPVDPDA
jgi:TonB family protein